MKITVIIVGLALLCGIVSNKVQSQSNIVHDTLTTTWKGFKRLDFKLENHEVRLTIPHKKATGAPWIWRARFPDYHSDINSLLLDAGFHVAYINTNNMYGSPKAITVWNNFYKFLTHKFQLNKKVVFHGHSRGGLFVYNWAKLNPDKVSCLYLDAPVCDFKSWPVGFGYSKRNHKDWNQLKLVYGFTSDSEAKSYTNNPIDHLHELAKAQIPVLHTINLNDSVVPPHENTIKLINTYISLGGIASVYPCSTEKASLDEHHYDIPNTEYVVNFIKQNLN
ncbi:prolyl oligopeptidase family serine peptidase [Tamlana fucoidanivorans]|uniref:Alpha/beta hydrolase n=1 Tax=Allotamlana fucoidanivorans TaxID=2583814 RepID=A0A5C4SQK3_9FLAO|nr:prolyl oligopeptidase family serine peptidase [Tamlana fucoidanivorans]TNJ46576.1 alpha/beta hydrolase [Tamlana fucoidanivorans]